METDLLAKKQSEKVQTKSYKNSQQQSFDSKRSSSRQRRKKVGWPLTQKNYNQRSRSRNKRSSRSKQQKKKHKHKHKSSKYRSRSRSNSRRRRQKSKDKKREKDRYRKHQRDRQYRGRSRQKRKQKIEDKKMMPTEIPMPPIPNQISMPFIPGDQRRRRQRSRSPLDYYRKNQNNNEGQFWDSFSWVPRINYTPNVSTSALANTKKMRRLMITNVPYEIGISEDNLRDIITRFMSRNYLKDQMNNCPVIITFQLSYLPSNKHAECVEWFHNGIVRLGDSIYGNNVLTQAQTAGIAQGAAFAAINVLENKKTNFNAETGPTFDSSSTVIRITNAVTPYMASHMNEDQWQDYYQDLIEGFSQYGKVIHDWFVKSSESDICADAGNLFIQYQYKENAEAAMAEMQNRIYDERSIKLYYWPRDLYYKNFRSQITPPVLPAPLKTVKQTK